MRLCRVIVAGLTFLALSISESEASSAPATSTPYVENVLANGETLEFTLSWLRLVGGNARMTLTPSADGERISISSVAVSSGILKKIFKVRDEIESIVDRSTFSTLRFQKKLNERDRYKEETTIIDEKRGVAIRKGKEIPVTQPIFDPLSLIFHLRRLDLTVGRKHFFTVIADGKVYTLENEVLRRESILTDAGYFKAVVVEPKMRRGGIFKEDEDARLLIWYTDDERRLPLRIRSDIPAGNITATLRSFRVGSPIPAKTPSTLGLRR
ncbi:MAG TPA: DUF3108 domain-containing protein [Thermoanaerobaculia bacterium]|nr:DUF3108 domain-containing protein [Thermoanaerobaculia bacterium]